MLIGPRNSLASFPLPKYYTNISRHQRTASCESCTTREYVSGAGGCVCTPCPAPATPSS